MTTNETLAGELSMPDAVEIARNSANDITRMIEVLDEVDRILDEELAVIVADIAKRRAANSVKREKAKARRRQARQLANELEAERDA